MQIAGADGFRRESLHAVNSLVEASVVQALQQADGLHGRGGDDDGVVSAGLVKLPAAIGQRLQGVDLGTRAHCAAMPFHIAGGRVGQQGTQIRFRDQHVGCPSARCAQAVAQHVDEDAGRGALGRSVECGQAQRIPHQPVQALRLVEALQQFADRAIVV
ncbi:hypothetical protein D3C81_1420730 [compost metagenome]